MTDAATKLKAVVREIAMRRSTYPKWVAAGRMTQEAANHEIAVMEAIAQDYSAIIDTNAQQEKLL